MSALPYRDPSPADGLSLDDAWNAYVLAQIPAIAEGMVRGIERTTPFPAWEAWLKRADAWRDADKKTRSFLDYSAIEPEPVYRVENRDALVAFLVGWLGTLRVEDVERIGCSDVVSALDREEWEAIEIERRSERGGRDE